MTISALQKRHLRRFVSLRGSGRCSSSSGSLKNPNCDSPNSSEEFPELPKRCSFSSYAILRMWESFAERCIPRSLRRWNTPSPHREESSTRSWMSCFDGGSKTSRVRAHLFPSHKPGMAALWNSRRSRYLAAPRTLPSTLRVWLVQTILDIFHFAPSFV